MPITRSEPPPVSEIVTFQCDACTAKVVSTRGRNTSGYKGKDFNPIWEDLPYGWNRIVFPITEAPLFSSYKVYCDGCSRLLVVR